MAICSSDITITSLETITAFDIDGSYLWTLDELQNATISNTEETSDITGKQGRRLNTLKLNKSATISGTNGLISSGLMSSQTGATRTSGATEIMWPEFVTVENVLTDTTVTGSQAKITYNPIGTEGDEISKVYLCTGDHTLGKVLKQDSTLAEGKFTFTPDTTNGGGTLAFYVDSTTHEPEVPDGSEIAVYYKRRINAETVENNTDEYAKKCTLYVDAFGEDVCNKVYHIQFYIPRASFNGNFDIAMGDTQAVHAFEATILEGGRCESGANKGLLWNYKIFADDAADVDEEDDSEEENNG